MGQTAPGLVISFPINGTEVCYAHFPDEQQKKIFFPLLLLPTFTPIIRQPTAGAELHLLVYVTVCTWGDGHVCTGVCVYAWVCVWKQGLLPAGRASGYHYVQAGVL